MLVQIGTILSLIISLGYLSACKANNVARETSPSKGGQVVPQQNSDANPNTPSNILPQTPVTLNSNNNGSTNQSGALQDLLIKATQFLSNLPQSNNSSNNSSTDTHTHTDTDTATQTENSNYVFKLSDFVDELRRSEYFFTINPVGMVQSSSPHGKVQVYYTKNIESYVSKYPMDEVPEGTIAISLFDNDASVAGPDGLAIMQKKNDGYDADGSNWYYRLVDRWSATVDQQEGVVAACQACHGDNTGKEFDYLKGLQKAAGK